MLLGMELLIRDWSVRVNLVDQVMLYGPEKKGLREELDAMVTVRDLLWENRVGNVIPEIPVLGEDDEG